MKVILHIGQQKTGSTILQDYLFQSRDFLHDNNILYPSSLGEKKQVKLLSQNEHLLDNNTEHYKAFQSELNSKTYQSIIISEENLFSIKTEKISRIKDWINSFAKEIVIFGYLRRQDDHLLSIYQQNVRGKNTSTIKQILNQFHYDSQHNYLNVIQRWRNIFPDCQFKIRPYSAIKNGTIIEDFCHEFGIPIYDAYQKPSLAVSNKSFDAISIELIRQMNILEKEEGFQFDHTLKRRMRVFLKNKERAEKFRLNQKDINAIKDKYLSSNIALCEALLNVELQEYLIDFPSTIEHDGLYNGNINRDDIYKLYFEVFEQVCEG